MIDDNKPQTTRPARIDLMLIGAAALTAWFGWGVFIATFNNFAVEVVRIQPGQLGVLESFREMPGLAVAFILALAMHLRESSLASVSLMLVALGFLGYSQTTEYPPLVLYSVIGSVGLHCWMSLQPAMTLALAEEGSKGKRLGQIVACNGLGTTLGIAAVLILRDRVTYSTWYVVSAAAFAVGTVIIAFVRKDLTPPDKPRLVFKRKYRLYYGLTFLEGCRRQVFMTFAIFALVKVYETPLSTIALLMLINNTVFLVGAPVVGKMIDRIGERRILVTSYGALIFVFIGYAVIRQPVALYVLYSLDNLLYLSTIGLTTYLNRTVEPRDLNPSITMGVTVNHLAAVTVPVVGGFLWAALGYQVTFFAGAGIVALSLLLARRMKPAGSSSVCQEPPVML